MSNLKQSCVVNNVTLLKNSFCRVVCTIGLTVCILVVTANRALTKGVFNSTADIEMFEGEGFDGPSVDTVPPISYEIAKIQLSKNLPLMGEVDSLHADFPHITFEVPVEYLANVPYLKFDLEYLTCKVQQDFETLPIAFQTAYYHEQQVFAYFKQNKSQFIEAVKALLKSFGATDQKVDDAFVDTIMRTTSLRVWFMQVLSHPEQWNDLEKTHPYHPKKRLLHDLEEYKRILVMMTDDGLETYPADEEMAFYNGLYNFFEYDLKIFLFTNPSEVGKCSSPLAIQTFIDALKESEFFPFVVSDENTFSFPSAYDESSKWNAVFFQFFIRLMNEKPTSE